MLLSLLTFGGVIIELSRSACYNIVRLRVERALDCDDIGFSVGVAVHIGY